MSTFSLKKKKLNVHLKLIKSNIFFIISISKGHEDREEDITSESDSFVKWIPSFYEIKIYYMLRLFGFS